MVVLKVESGDSGVGLRWEGFSSHKAFFSFEANADALQGDDTLIQAPSFRLETHRPKGLRIDADMNMKTSICR